MMPMDFSSGWLLLAFIPLGLLSGGLAGLLGIGGGLITTPLLFETFLVMGVPDGDAMPLAVGTSLAVILPTGFVSAWNHWKQGTTDLKFLFIWVFTAPIGALSGALVASQVHGQTLSWIFALWILPIAAWMAFGKEGSKEAKEELQPPRVTRLGRLLGLWPLRAFVGYGIGLFASLMGIGGGAFSTPIMVLSGFDIRRAIGTSAAVGISVALPGTIGFLAAGFERTHDIPGTVGFVYPLAVIALLPTSLVAARYGARATLRWDQCLLRKIFAVLLSITACRILWHLLV